MLEALAVRDIGSTELVYIHIYYIEMADVHDLFTFIWLFFVVFIELYETIYVNTSPKRIVGLQQCGIKQWLVGKDTS